jgi:hypothetical protein
VVFSPRLRARGWWVAGTTKGNVAMTSGFYARAREALMAGGFCGE